MVCTSRGNSSTLSGVEGITVTDEVGSNSFSLLEMATSFSNRVVNPYIIILALFFTLLSFSLTIWHSCKILPKRQVFQKLSLASTVVAWALNLVDTFWIQVASNAVRRTVEPASMQVLTASRGSRAYGMAWTSVTFLTISLGLMIRLFLKEVRAVPEKEAKGSEV